MECFYSIPGRDAYASYIKFFVTKVLYTSLCKMFASCTGYWIFTWIANFPGVCPKQYIVSL